MLKFNFDALELTATAYDLNTSYVKVQWKNNYVRLYNSKI